MQYIDQNWSPIGTGTAGQLLNTPGLNGEPLTGVSPANPNYGGATGGRIAYTGLMRTQGNTNYNSLQARTNGRVHDLTFNLGFTWAKNLGYQGTSDSSHALAIPNL